MIWEMLRRHEGLRLTAYRDTRGFWTIGYGWNLDAHPLPADMAACLRTTGAITEEMAEELLTIAVDCVIMQCRAIYPGFEKFTEARRNALTDFVFNLGSKGAVNFTKMLAAIKVGDWEQAADDMYFSKWRTQVGARSNELIGMIRVG